MEKVNVAIAEDDFRIAEIHSQFLSRIPEVRIAGKALSAAQTIDLLKGCKVDLLLLDIYMPDMLGTDLLLRIREEFPKVDIVMITAATDKNFLQTAMRNGVLNYLIKPVTMERFVHIITSYIEQRDMLNNKEEIDQDFVDRVFKKSGYIAKTSPLSALPKGIDPITLNKVEQVLDQSQKGLSAEQIGNKMGASRTTARRYLEYLISENKCRAEVEYGIVGRPERHYYQR